MKKFIPLLVGALTGIVLGVGGFYGAQKLNLLPSVIISETNDSNADITTDTQSNESNSQSETTDDSTSNSADDENAVTEDNAQSPDENGQSEATADNSANGAEDAQNDITSAAAESPAATNQNGTTADSPTNVTENGQNAAVGALPPNATAATQNGVTNGTATSPAVTSQNGAAASSSRANGTENGQNAAVGPLPPNATVTTQNGATNGTATSPTATSQNGTTASTATQGTQQRLTQPSTQSSSTGGSAPNADPEVNIDGFNGGLLQTITVAQANRFIYDTWIKVRGNIVEKIGDEEYLFRDRTGIIKVGVENKYWEGRAINPNDVIEITGELIKNWSSSEINAKNIEIITLQ